MVPRQEEGGDMGLFLQSSDASLSSERALHCIKGKRVKSKVLKKKML